MALLAVGPPTFTPRLAIFDKDGTLIDFHAMWSSWIETLALRLEDAAGRPLALHIFHAVGYDSSQHRALAGSPLAVAPMADLRQLIADAVCRAGCGAGAEPLVERLWFIPDPVKTARPLVDLTQLFQTLRERDIRIAIATSDDRVPTEATLAALGLAALVTVVVCANDGLPCKPAPDMALAACRAAAVCPSQAFLVGDSVADMQMAAAAGLGLRIGVLSGVSSREVLALHAEVVVASASELL